MDHSKMDHSKMDHSKMDHSKMDHSKMDHSKMDHSKMDHSKMDHGQHEMSDMHAGMKHESMANMHHMHHSQSAMPLVLSSIFIFLIIGIYFFRKTKESFTPSTKRNNLFQFYFLKKMMKSNYFIFNFRLIPAITFLFILATGLWGSARGNLAAPFTWLFWWTLLIFFVAFAGKVFCMACPWDFFANLFQFGWFHKKSNSLSGLGLKWPKSLANIHLASLFFIIFTWLELTGVATDSFVTAVLGLGFVCSAVLIALFFKDRPFCRYLCPIGRISGIYAQFSPLEIRANDLSVCDSCKTKECVKGTDTTTKCPTGEIPFKLKENTFCTLCTECIKSCEKDNMVLRARPLATDLLTEKKLYFDEILLVILILVLTFFHGLTMTPTWFKWTDFIGTSLSVDYTMAFSILMPAILLISFFVFYLFSKIVGNVKGMLALIPLALGYHFGHNLMHLFSESLNLVSYLNDPFGWGWNVFGLKDFNAFPLLGHSSSQILQFVCIALGFYYSIKTIRVRIKEQFFSHYFLTFAIAMTGLWLVTQPMVMRTMHE